MKNAISVRHLSKRFRRYRPDRPWTLQETVVGGFGGLRPVEEFWGLNDVSFDVPAGRAVGVVGANGSGKSTLLRLIGGVGRPDSGSVDVSGRIAALLDLGTGFHYDLTGRENVFVAGVVSGLTRQEVATRFDAIVAFAELEKSIDNPFRTYSTGMQMRLAFAVAVHADPDILLIDEVLSVGDLAFQRKCLGRITEFKEQGCSIVLVSHEASVVREMCDEALWLCDGRLILWGEADAVVDQYVAHMEIKGQPLPEVSPARLETAVAEEEPVRTPQPAGLVMNENRFGSLELEITAVRFLDGEGRPAESLESGGALCVEIDYLAPQLIVGPIFQVHIFRKDDLVCCDLSTETTGSETWPVQGRGRVSLYLQRLDLCGGLYYVDVGCYARGWAYAYDYHSGCYPLTVRGAGSEAVLHPPHRWELRIDAQGLGKGAGHSLESRAS